jgi:hypothetical protein
MGKVVHKHRLAADSGKMRLLPVTLLFAIK